MFTRIFAILRTTFLMFNVVRASDQDKFNDNKCIWCTYYLAGAHTTKTILLLACGLAATYSDATVSQK
ncbi:hypothetical protein AG0111_0g12409 [Alternaria gaisen]|uniref:Uncharacterized protein n=1 Tax=Alternaria gaisen TaxID=167740 RepID=A0ACB6F4Y3_9PLEO|nr:hypothetical protein AG0111_0g12409 [Alternaria gaisen]